MIDEHIEIIMIGKADVVVVNDVLVPAASTVLILYIKYFPSKIYELPSVPVAQTSKMD